jgi:methionyl-tRNA synthetase
MAEITFDEFQKVELKVGQVIAVKDHPNADKLVVLDVDLGSEKRQLVAGLKGYMDVGKLKGKKIVVVANLKPAKLRGVESQGMLLAAEKDGKLALITVDRDIDNGAAIR